MKILARLSDNGKTEANLEVTPTGLTKTQKGGQVAMIKITLEWFYASLKIFNFERFFEKNPSKSLKPFIHFATVLQNNEKFLRVYKGTFFKKFP